MFFKKTNSNNNKKRNKEKLIKNEKIKKIFEKKK